MIAAQALATRRRRRQPEETFQAALVEALNLVIPRDAILFAVPNGGLRSKIEAKILVGQGVVPGIPDLMILWDGRGWGLECKAPKGSLSADQKDVHARFARAAVPVAVVRTIHDAIEFLNASGLPLRCRGIF